MGKARIISQLEPGRYQIELDHGTLQRDVMIAEIDTLLQGEELALQDADATIAELQEQLDTKVSALNTLIDEMNHPPEPEDEDEDEDDDAEDAPDITERISTAIIDVERARLSLNRASRLRANLLMKLTGLRLKRAALERIETDKTIEAWCTDGEPDMTGEVGTAEVPGEPMMPILIKPGFEESAGYDQARDGQMIERPLMSGAQAYLNAALLPGWQKWRPTYRFGIITEIDETADTCTIEIEPSRSSAQNLDVEPIGALTAVPIEYRECNAAAFQEGDSVLIEYRGQLADAPVVIGFKENPRYCDPYVIISYTAHNSTLDQSWCNYLIWDNRTETAVKASAELFNPSSFLRIRSAVVQRGNELLFSASRFPGAEETPLDVLTVASRGGSGFRITDNGADVEINDLTLVSDGLRLYAIDADERYILQVGEAYQVTKKIPVPVLENTFALSEPYGDFIACAGYDGGSYPFVSLYRISTGEQVYYSTFGSEFGYISGPYIGLGARGIAVCDFDGVLHIHQPVDWNEPDGGWSTYDLGNVTYFPEGIVMTDDYLFINRAIPASGGYTFDFRRYSFADGSWKSYGDLMPSGIGRRITGYMTTVKKVL